MIVGLSLAVGEGNDKTSQKPNQNETKKTAQTAVLLSLEKIAKIMRAFWHCK
jgi:hypothetical protein